MNVASIPSILISRYAWLIFVFVTCANGAAWWYRGRQNMAANPELKSGYSKLVRSWLIYGNIPWLVMGAGIEFGSVRSILHYLNPRGGSFVIAFYLTVVALWIATFNWLFFRGGAEALVVHPGLLNFPLKEPRAVKVIFLLMLGGGIFGLVMMLLGDVPIPN